MNNLVSLSDKICLKGFRPIYAFGDKVSPEDPKCYKVKSGLVLLSGGLGGIKNFLTPCILQTGDYFGEEEIVGESSRLFSAYAYVGTELERIAESPEVLIALLTDAVRRHSIQVEIHALGTAKAKVKFIRELYANLYLAESLIAKLANITRETAARVSCMED